MLDITSKLNIVKKLLDFSGSIRSRIVMICMGIVLVVVIVLNTYPLYVSQSLIIETKRDKLMSKASFIASTLSYSEYLSKNKAALVMEAHDVDDNQRIIICDNTGRALYDNSLIDSVLDRLILRMEIISALEGSDSFDARYRNHVLECRVAVPVKLHNNVMGAVYIWETDNAQAAILDGIQVNMRWLSLLISLVLFVVIFAFSTALVRRLNRLLAGIRKVRDGAYGDTILQDGHDEIAEISSEFNKMSIRIRETEDLRRTFVSDASHELRTPLASIRLLTDSIMQTDNIDMDTTREFMGDIGEEIDRLTRIAEKLLVLTKLDGAKELEMGRVDLRQVIEAAMATLEPIAQEAEVELICNLSDDCNILADKDGAYQIVFNLVENAIKYNRAGGFVRIFLFVKEEMCNLIVDDNGIGIPEDDYERIFERFYRVDKARTRSGKGGTGLGLSIVLKNVENYGGTIQVEPSVEGGVRFTVVFSQLTEEVKS